MKHLLITASLMILAAVLAYPIGVRQATDILARQRWERMVITEATPSAVVIPTTVTVKGEPVDEWEMLKGRPAGNK